MNMFDFALGYNAGRGASGGGPSVSDTSGGVEPDFRGLSYGYLNNSGKFYSGTSKNAYLNVFPIKGGKSYLLTFVKTTGDVWRGGFYAGRSYADFEPYITNPDSAPTEKFTASYSVSSPLGNRVQYDAAVDGVFVVETNYSGNESPLYCLEEL